MKRLLVKNKNNCCLLYKSICKNTFKSTSISIPNICEGKNYGLEVVDMLFEFELTPTLLIYILLFLLTNVVNYLNNRQIIVDIINMKYYISHL